MKNRFRHLIAALALLVPVAGFANTAPALEKAPIDIRDVESLQRGAHTFTNYCLSCHSASFMRFNRLQDLSLTEAQIKENLMFTTDKIGDTMNAAMSSKDAAQWFGAAPPDLTIIARSRGADYLYAYMRGFYRDETRPTGWNNTVFDKAGMPHILWEWQGEQRMQVVKDKNGHEEHKLVLTKPGTMTKIVDGKADTADYDRRAADLVNYMVYMAEPVQTKRHQIGAMVILFLSLVLLPLAYFLKKEYWKDVH